MLQVAKFILRYRLGLIIGMFLITVGMGWKAFNTQLSYDLARVLPPSDSTMQVYQQFKSRFGEDGNVMVLGFSSKRIFDQEILNEWNQLENRLKQIHGVDQTLSILSVPIPQFDKQNHTVTFHPVSSIKDADSIQQIVEHNPAFEGLVYNPSSQSTLMALTIRHEVLNSPDRNQLIEQINSEAAHFEKQTNIEVHQSGMPYIRYEYMKLVSKEMILFMVLALLITSGVLLWFFKSLAVVLFSVLILVVEVIWSMGLLNILNYKVSILVGLLPSLVIIISIPNTIFLLNRYYSEYAISKQKFYSISRTIQGMWLSLLLANVTTAIGFAVFYFTGSVMLQEFGCVASFSIMTTFLVTMLLVPILLSYLPAPKGLRAVHLKAARTNYVLNFISKLVLNHRKAIYVVVSVLTVISCWGMLKVRQVGYVVDDLPSDHPVYADLQFFEKEFGGVLPLEISIDTQKKQGVSSSGGKTMYKIQALQRALASHDELSRPLSLPEGIKFLHQWYRGGQEKYYAMPPLRDLHELVSYFKGKNTQNQLSSFADSTGQFTRITYRMKDIGSARLKSMMETIKPQIDSVFPPSEYKVDVTGMSVVFLKNNDYLLGNLFESLIIEIVLIALIGMVLFRSIRIILFSKLPCLIPLLLTAGIMGFAGVEFKSSTILIFTIALGLASDGTIYFLTRYRHELTIKGKSPEEAVTITIRETGLSMIYTALILFAGFAIFSVSAFGGTKALGILVSSTLFMSMITNLILLPAILLSIHKTRSKKAALFETSKQ
ncbi:MAG: MMPL family transporter [Breznakibacter sp.]